MGRSGYRKQDISSGWPAAARQTEGSNFQESSIRKTNDVMSNERANKTCTAHIHPKAIVVWRGRPLTQLDVHRTHTPRCEVKKALWRMHAVMRKEVGCED